MISGNSIRRTMQTVRDICRQNRQVLGGFDKAEEVAEAIENNEPLPKEAYQIINQLAFVSIRNMRNY